MECNKICLQNSSTDFYNTPATFHYIPFVSPFKVYKLLTITDKYTKQKEVSCFLGRPDPQLQKGSISSTPGGSLSITDITLSDAN